MNGQPAANQPPAQREQERAPLGAALEWLGDRLNPILVKETRQALKSKQFTLWFVLLLVACWVTTIGAVAFIGPSIYYLSAGSRVLFYYYVVLTLPLVVVTPFSAYRSLSSEHEDNTRDLLEVSSLTPRQVIHGKLGSAAVQVVIYLSALAPCIAFTYLLRGVGLVQIALLLAYAVLASLGLSMVGILLAAATKQKHVQVLLSVALVGGLFYCFYGLIEFSQILLGASGFGPQFWWLNAAALSLYATTFGVVYTAAISLTTFTSANRSTGLRVALFIQQAVYVAWITAGVTLGISGDEFFYAFALAAGYWFLAGAAMTGEAPTLSLRVRRSLPQSLLGRALGTWFNPGAGSGYVFAVTNLITLTALAIACCLFVFIDKTEAKTIGLLAAYVVVYLGLGRLAILGLRRVSEVSALGCFLVQVLFVLGGTGLPFVLRTLFDQARASSLFIPSLLSPPWTLGGVMQGQIDPAREFSVLVAVGCAAGIVGLLNLALAGYEARQLRVAAPKRIVEDDLELNPPPEPQPTNPWGDRAESVVESP